MKLIDTHAHVEEINDLESVIQRAKMNNIIGIIAVGSSIKSNDDILSLASKYKGFIYPSIGIHPIEAETDIELASTQIISNIDHCVAIGEIGLDYQSSIYHGRRHEETAPVCVCLAPVPRPRRVDFVFCLLELEKGAFSSLSLPKLNTSISPESTFTIALTLPCLTDFSSPFFRGFPPKATAASLKTIFETL